MTPKQKLIEAVEKEKKNFEEIKNLLKSKKAVIDQLLDQYRGRLYEG